MANSGRPLKVDPRVDDLQQHIRFNEFETAKQLLSEFGVDVQDGDGRTALINSVIDEKFEFLRWLTEQGADIDSQDRNGYTALHFVGLNRFSEIGKYLIEKGANVELRDSFGNTPLWTAVMNAKGDFSVVKLLLENGANTDNVNNAGRTPGQMLTAFVGEDFRSQILEGKV